MGKYIQEARKNFAFTQSLRRDFHKFPELGFKEIRTSEIIASRLIALGLDVTSGIAHTGVLGVLKGRKPGKTILLRFDMDALPIQEVNQVEYKSQSAGVMHACGHDGHMAMGLTVAQILAEHRDEIQGKILFVFQPAEEGLGGASQMIQEGVLEGLFPDYCLGMHLWNEKPVGWASVVAGPAMAGADFFTVKIIGRGGHGALPHQVHDPIQAAAQVISSLQTIVSRNVSPLQSAVVSVTQINGGDAYNVIPQSIELGGTIRTFEIKVRDLVLQRFHEIIDGISKSMGCEAEINLWQLTPAVINHPVVSRMVEEILVENAVSHLDTQTKTMASEDMAEFLSRIPGCFFMVGSANVEKGMIFPHHHPNFDFDEEALVFGSGWMCEAAMGILTRQPSV